MSTTLRIECLRLAVQAGENDAVGAAERYLKFVQADGDKRNGWKSALKNLDVIQSEFKRRADQGLPYPTLEELDSAVLQAMQSESTGSGVSSVQ